MSDQVLHPRRSGMRFTFQALLIAVVIFIGVAPTLAWMEFSSGSENLIVATVLEMRRGGPWLVPNLNGAPRTSKPPMVNWISAKLIRAETMAGLSDPARRDAAYRELYWEVRWPALVLACFGLIAGAWLGRALFGDAVGLATAAIMGSSVLFLRFGRTMSTDVALMLTVTSANALFALALLEGRRWLGGIAGGIALGLALMSKGPVALAQTVVPIALFVAWRWWKRPVEQEHRIGWTPAVVAAVFALAVALPWPLVVLSCMSGQIGFWYRQITAGGNTETGADAPWVYLAIIPLIIPWIGFLFLGLVLLIRERTERGMLVLLMLIAPLAVMTCFSEKNDRYLLPMLAPAAVICAVGLFRRGKDVEPAQRVIAALTWGALAAIALGLPIAGTFLKRIDGPAWWSWKFAVVIGLAGFAAVGAIWGQQRRGRGVLPAAGIVVMLWCHGLFIYGYKDSVRGRSDGRPIADILCQTLPPDSPVWCYSEPGNPARFSRVPNDVIIYLNRVVRPATQPTTLPTDSRRNGLMVHMRGNQPVPPGLERWELVRSSPKNNGTWRVYVGPK